METQDKQQTTDLKVQAGTASSFKTLQELLNNNSLESEGVKHFIIIDDGENTVISTHSSCIWLVEKLYTLGKKDPSIVRILRAVLELLEATPEK